MTVHELAARLNSDRPPVIVDVRDADELEISRLENSVHIPMAEIGERHVELDGQADVAVLCRSGGRSARVVEQLRSLGYQNVENVDGGINAWAENIDPTMAIY